MEMYCSLREGPVRGLQTCRLLLMVPDSWCMERQEMFAGLVAPLGHSFLRVPMFVCLCKFRRHRIMEVEGMG